MSALQRSEKHYSPSQPSLEPFLRARERALDSPVLDWTVTVLGLMNSLCVLGFLGILCLLCPEQSRTVQEGPGTVQGRPFQPSPVSGTVPPDLDPNHSPRA